MRQRQEAARRRAPKIPLRLQEDRRFAERFEFYVCGVELANGFGELTDAVDQRRRFVAAMAERRRIYGDDYPIDEEFLAALTEMPQASGIAPTAARKSSSIGQAAP